MLRTRRQKTMFSAVATAFLAVLLLATSGCAARLGPDGQPLTLDERITEDVERILADEEGLVVADITVQSREGVVILSGVQEDAGPLGAALLRIARVQGVVEVINRVRILRDSLPSPEPRFG